MSFSINFNGKGVLGHSPGCGINDDVMQWMNQVQNADVDEVEANDGEKIGVDTLKSPVNEAKRKHKKVPTQSTSSQQQQQQQQQHKLNYEDKFNKYSKVANEEDGFRRHKRAATRQEENKNTCSLYIQTDPLIWKHIREGFPEVKGLFLFK